MKRTTVLAEELSWTEFAEHMKRDDVIVIPLGMTEQHGLHNPLGTDTFIARYCAAAIAEKAHTLAAPVFPYGYGPEGQRFPGQVSLSAALLRKVWYGYTASYAKHGARRFLFVNGHGGNSPIVRTLAGDLWRDFRALVSVTDWWTSVPRIRPDLPCNDHGGFSETSCMLAVKAGLVDMSAARDPVPDVVLGGGITAAYTVQCNGKPFWAAMDDWTLGRVGNLGKSPIGANAEYGQKVLEAYIDFSAQLIEELRKVDLTKECYV
jgi:creatinine amidohydrolase